MNTKEYLRKQGWRGDGHSLDKTGRGIKRPLLISKKVDVLGVGLNKHAAVSDQWWLRAFDQSLKDFGSGKESMLANVQKLGVNRGGLYGRFVQGESIAGTFDDTPQTSAPSTPPAIADQSSTKKRKRSKKGDQSTVSATVSTEVQPTAMSAQKLEQYRERAAEKGMTIEDYIRKREAKNKAKREGKMKAEEDNYDQKTTKGTISISQNQKTSRKKRDET